MSETNTYITLFAYVCTAVGIIFIANVIRVFQKTENATYTNFLQTNIMRKNEKVRDIVYYKIIKSPKFVSIMRRDALLFLTIIMVSAYSYVGYLYTEKDSDLIAAIIPFVILGLFYASSTHAQDKDVFGAMSVVFESVASMLFTGSALLACEIVRGTFSIPLYVPFILIVVSLIIYFMSVWKYNTSTRDEMKENVSSGLKADTVRHLSQNGFEAESSQADLSWVLDTKTYLVFSTYDILIIFVPLFIFGIVYCFKPNNWEYAILALFATPLFYWGFQLVLLFTNGFSARVFFNIILSTMTVTTLLLILLYNLNLVGSRVELYIGIPSFLTMMLFLISIVYKNPVTVPFLTVSCVAKDVDGNACYIKKTTNVQSNESTTTIDTSNVNGKNSSV